ncbi:MAG: GNAT family N-acetyltransferase [Bacteroidota bacterium]
MSDGEFRVRNTRPGDFERIEDLSLKVYPNDFPWTADYLSSHLDVFPEGQFVAVDAADYVVGMAASLIVNWEDYDHLDSYNDFTDRGYFRNHDPSGRTLYGAEVMVDPEFRGKGIGSLVYDARRALVQELGLLRIRAGARLPGYAAVADRINPRDYVLEVSKGTRYDATLSFQLKHGFHVLAIVPAYQVNDPRSRNFAALIEWLNPDLATEEDYRRQRRYFLDTIHGE